MKTGAIFFDVLGFFYIYIVVAVLCILGAVYWTRVVIACINIAMMACFAMLFGLIAFVFSGPFDVMMRVACFFVIGLNVACISTWLLMHRRISFRTIDPPAGRDARRRAIAWTAIIASIAGLGIPAFSGFWFSYTVMAPDGATTRSSFWGSPTLILLQATSRVEVADNYTFTISNDTLDADPPGFSNNTMAYIDKVIAGNGSDQTNHTDYMAGARSYPNGTVFLPAPLPSLSNVTVTFHYVSNHDVLQALQVTNATLILNVHGAFTADPDPFHFINQTYLFQLLDAWEIEFYLDVSNGIDYPHAFNYGSTILVCYETLNWARQWNRFSGISLDFEAGEVPIPGGIPGGVALPPGYLLPDIPFLNLDELHWYFLNEQNETLFADAWNAYEDMYDYASGLGYKSYLVIGDEVLHEFIDDDMDCHREPVCPRSPNADVIYGTMSYHESDVEGRYKLYRDCIDQINMFGLQGRSILTGWILSGSNYYTDDQAGLERYIDDCLIAQAAGMAELFHAPLAGLQSKWGDDAIMALDQALNEAPKESFTFQAPGFVFHDYFFFDFLENFNRPLIVAAIMAFAALVILVPVMARLARARRCRKQKV